MRKRTALVLLAAITAAACGDSATPPAAIAPECNPLGGAGCLLPWPSQAYLKRDESTPSGFRLDLPIAAMPANTDKKAIDPTPLDARWDGFSPTGPMIAMFPDGVSPDGLPSFKNPDESLAPNSPIVLLDLDRGVRYPFFAE